MIPLARPSFGDEEERAVIAALRSGWVTQGPRVAEFERAFAAYLGQAEAVAVSSATTGLHLSLRAAGVGPGDEVIVPSFSFIATANAVVHAGAVPVFADIDLATYNLSLASTRAALSPRTRAIVLVDQVGLPADTRAFAGLAAGAGAALVEDAACAIGSRVNGRLAGGDARLAVFSFHPRKLLTTGEGGMVVTSDPALARRLRSLRHHGVSVSDHERHVADRVVVEAYTEVGYNFRMTDLQAAVGLVQLARIDGFVRERIELGERYTRAFAACPRLAPPVVPPGVTFNFQTYVLRLREDARIDRDGLMQRLLERKIASRRGVMAAHLEPAYAATPRRVPLPNTERAAATTIALPLFSGMTAAEQQEVVDAVLEAV